MEAQKSNLTKLFQFMLALALVAASLFVVSEAIAAYQRTADNTVPAFTNPELTQRNGNERVDKGDLVTVFEERGNAYYVRYPTPNGTKDRWVPKNIFNSNPNSNTVTLNDGWYRIQPMHDLGRSVDALGPQIGNGNNVHMWTTVDALQQKFYLQNRGNGYFSLQSAYGSRLFVTVNGQGNGANLYTAGWSNSDSQLFRLVNAGNNSYHIFSKVGTNLNFDCAGGGRSDGNNVQLWTTENSAWHKWRFTPVSVNTSLISTTNYVWPVDGYYILTTLFYYNGIQRSMGYKHSVWWNRENGGHFNALDVSCNNGTKVKAVAAGIITSETQGTNHIIVIQHDNGMKSLYAHLRKKLVSPGTHVSAGQVIAESGDVGASGSYHLHLEFSNISPWEYFRDKVPFRYCKSTLNAYNNRCSTQDKKRFSEAVDWIQRYGGGFTVN